MTVPTTVTLSPALNRSTRSACKITMIDLPNHRDDDVVDDDDDDDSDDDDVVDDDDDDDDDDEDGSIVEMVGSR